MKDFFKHLLATVAGIVLVSLAGLIFTFGLIGTLSQKEEVKIKPNSVLVIKIDKAITERKPKGLFDGLPILGSDEVYGLNDIIGAISKASTDPNIKGIVLSNPIEFTAGLATLDEIRHALKAFRDSGKFVISYGETYSQASYYLASVSNKIYLNPEGSIAFRGLHSEFMFFKGTLEKLGVKAEIIRHGKFKAAIEPFILDKMSKENKEQWDVVLKSMWGYMLTEIGQSRKVDVAKLNLLADNLDLFDASACLENGIVDTLAYKDNLLDDIAKRTDNKNIKDISFVGLSRYIKVPVKTASYFAPKVAVVYAYGDVVDGEGKEGEIGAGRISAAIRDARLDSTIKAIVLRVNSGGGSALASEVIWRELDLARKVKPVIASFGDVAASGGYYIAVPADTIVASPLTISGSIGVFGMLMNAEDFFDKKLGITFDRVNSNKYSDIGSYSRPLTKDEEKVIEKGIERIYGSFVKHVSDGRGLSPENVDSIGQGRIWSGVSSKEIKLVDCFGGLNEAIKIAAAKAKLKNYRVTELPKLEDPFTQLMQMLTDEASTRAVRSELGENYRYYKQLKDFMKLQGIQARLPYNVEVY
jgi:protease IV